MRRETANPLTSQEHRQLGSEIRATNARLHRLCDFVVAVYGPNNRAAFSFLKTVEAMDRLCVDLEGQANRDCPEVLNESFYL